MTFRDYIYECENYQYSAEHYELMKECAELELMEKYLDNQQFVSNINESAISSLNITPDYFAESVDDNSIQKIYEEAEEKKNATFQKIAKVIVGAFWKFINAMKKFFSNYKRYADVALNNQKKLQQAEYEIREDYADKLSDFIDRSIHDDVKNLFDKIVKEDISVRSNTMRTFKVLFDENIDESKEKVLNKVIVLGTRNIDIGNVKYTKAIDIKDLINIMKDLSKDKNKIDVASINAKIAAAEKKVIDKGVTIYSDPDKIEDLLNKLDAIYNDSKNTDTDNDLDAEYSKEFVHLATNIQEIYGATTKLYTSFLTLKKVCVEGVDNLLKEADRDNGVKYSKIGKAKKVDVTGTAKDIADKISDRVKRGNDEDEE